MANPSVSISDDVLDEFDDKLWELKMMDEVPRKTSRSQVVQMLMEEWIETPAEAEEGNTKAEAKVAD